jgi:hypothetical protein
MKFSGVILVRRAFRRPAPMPTISLVHLLPCLVAGLGVLTASAASPHQFLGWTNFTAFTATTNNTGEVELLSPVTPARPWRELVPTWNADLAATGWLRAEARAWRGGVATKFYSFGQWSRDTNHHPRFSVKGQRDADGDVDTDTLQLATSAEAFQLSLTFDSATSAGRLKFLGAVLTDPEVSVAPREPLRAVWGRPAVNVPTISQLAYRDGKAWCSPTTITMLLRYWSAKLEIPALTFDVPEVAGGVHDTTWRGTGNWSFNLAYVGALPGMRGVVTRFNDVRELEDWIAWGWPVGVSLCYDRLRAKGPGPNGHLMICVGFADNGDIILNDPGTRFQMRKAWPRERFTEAWANSRNTVYLVFPDDATPPADTFGHWTISR